MKASDKKQREKAYLGMLESMNNLMNAVILAEQVPLGKMSVDEMNQIATRINKLANYMSKMAELRQIYQKDAETK